MKYALLYALRAISFLRCVLRFMMPFAIHCKRLVTHYAMNKIPSSLAAKRCSNRFKIHWQLDAWCMFCYVF